MFFAADGRYPVTTFHPIRPFVRWSSVVSRRAKGKGCSKPVPAVMPMPRCSVAPAMAEASRIGSETGTCAACLIAASPLPL